jgi:hypothetical protein
VSVTAIPRGGGAATDVPVTDSNQIRHNWHMSKRETTTGPSMSFIKIREGQQTGWIRSQSQVKAAASTEVRPKCSYMASDFYNTTGNVPEDITHEITNFNACRLGGTFQHLSWTMTIPNLGCVSQQTCREV